VSDTASKKDHIHYIPPQGDYFTFNDEEHYLAKGIEWGILTARSVKKELVFKTGRHEERVTLKGYQEYGIDGQFNTIVLEFEDGELSCIHPAYLKEMQSAGFTKELLSGGSKEYSAKKEGTDKILTEAEASESAFVERPAVVKKAKAKKAPAKPKLELPEEKVHFIGSVKEFTEKMNHFTGETDEVILFENLKIIGEAELYIGDAWCGYSKTLKKLELAEGDGLEFDGKIVDKKFSKEVRYKVNNPSKLKKMENN